MLGVLLALGLAALALNLPAGTHASKPAGALKGEPVPTLFPTARLGLVERLVRAEQARARRDIVRYLTAFPGRNDPVFATFALNSVGPPPTGAAQQAELGLLHRIDARRTAVGVRAATWLESHGKHDIWKLYLKQFQQQAPKPAAARAKTLFRASYLLANTIAKTGKARFARPSPYITDPTLRALNQKRFAKKFSYPAKHAVIAFTLAPQLSRLEPARAGEFRYMADEIAYSRIYAGGHYPSDIAAGAYLGTLISEYERRVPAPPA
ncbi:MAG: phosphatase family protein [Solirubrobacterales bacterium]|nr:phosphatase family protein [Solirubrobacterales bacterium]